jgi:hypothetical protein
MCAAVVRFAPSKERTMLKSSYGSPLSEQDQHIFETLVPATHYLWQVLAVVNFECFRSLMTPCYHATDGRPADDPVVLLKLCYLQTHYGLSDRAVIAHAQVKAGRASAHHPIRMILAPASHRRSSACSSRSGQRADNLDKHP